MKEKNQNSKTNNKLKKICIKRGYVPPDCKNNESVIAASASSKRNPCNGCTLNCSHAYLIAEKPVIDDRCLQMYFQTKYENLVKEQRIKHRTKMLYKRPVKIIMHIDIDRKEIYVSVMDLLNEKMYCKRFCNITEASEQIPNICSQYSVDQILMEADVYGNELYSRIANAVYADIVPMKYEFMR